MQKYQYEIEYYFQPDKDNPPRTHWMYVVVEAKTLAASKTKAVEHYNKQTRECGWTKYCTLNEIRPIKKGNDPPRNKTNTDLSGTREPVKSSPRKSKPAARNTKSTGGTRSRKTNGKAAAKPTTRKKK